MKDVMRCIEGHLHESRIVMGDTNAEEIFQSTIGRWSWHDSPDNNGMRATGFAISNNMAVCIFLTKVL
jgi:hypothetical protein